MRTFINLFLIAYLGDALLSVTDELVKLMFAANLLNEGRNVLALTVLAWACLVYITLAFDSRIPKYLVVPLIAYLFLVSFFSSLLYPIFSETKVNTVVAIGQFLLIVAILHKLRGRATGSWLLRDADLSGRAFSWREFRRFALVNVGIIVVALPVLIYLVTVEAVRQASSAFIRIDYAGLYLTEKQYRSSDQVIRLIPMIHIGEPSFYAAVSDALSSERAVILAEGVSDDNDLMGGFRGAQEAAQILGLESQTDMLVEGDYINLDDIEQNSQSDKGPFTPKIVQADIDSASLREETRNYLNHVGMLVKQHESMWDAMHAIYAWADKNVTPEAQSRIYADILDKRNIVLLEHLDKSLTVFNEIIIPWGAMHMPALEKSILKRGFEQSSSLERSAVRFWD